MNPTRTFHGRDLREAMAAVERALGQDARVLSTHTDARGVRITAEPAGLAPLRSRDCAWQEDARAFGLPDAMLASLAREVARVDAHSRETIARRLAVRIAVAPPFAARCQALVGPTGVGKTTTIAKLATLALESGRRVRLLTLDTTRPGGVEQLQAHARSLELRLDVATNTGDFVRLARSRATDELVLVDTAGRGPHDRAAREATQCALREARAQVTVCLQANMRREDAAASLRAWRASHPSALIVTKWDETEVPGEVLALAIEQQLPLSWITHGQGVPKDIVAADALVLASHAVGLDARAAERMFAE